MTNNAWNTPDLTSDGKVLIGNGANSPSANTITAGANCTVTNGAGSIQLEFSGSASADFVLVDTATASGSLYIAFTGLSSTYFSYIIVIDKYIPATDGQPLVMRTSSNGGSSYDSGGSDYYFRGWRIGDDGSLNYNNAVGSYASLAGSTGSPPGTATNESCSCITTIHNPSSTGITRITNLAVVIDSSGDNHFQSIEGGRIQTAAVNAIKLYATSGNIEAADIRLYGMKAS